MNSTPSRLLTRLDAEIAAQRDPLRADCLRAERAAYLVRQGHADEAKAELGALHQRHDGRPNVEMSAWMNLVESLLSFFSDMGPVALDKMRRARALSEAAGLTQLHALSAAWLAHLDYGRHDFVAMAFHVTQALRLAATDHHAARSRASLVIAQGLHLAGHPKLAAPWYKRARDHAVADGDEVTTSALMHNMAWLRMHALRQARMTGGGEAAGPGFALMEMDSIVQYDQLIGTTSLESLKPILRAQILALNGQASEALVLFDEHISNQPGGMARLHCTWQADRAWCLLELGRAEEARHAAAQAQASFVAETQVDDRAATHSRLAQVFGALGDADIAKHHQRVADGAWSEYAEMQQKLHELLGPLSDAEV